MQILFGHFWPVFISATVGVAIAWSMQRGRPPFFTPKSLPELTGRTEAEQRRLVREATLQTFKSWRVLLPVLPLPLALAVGVGLSHALPTISSLPDSFWLRLGVVTVFGSLGGWLTTRLVTVYLRPVLRRLLESPHHGT